MCNSTKSIQRQVHFACNRKFLLGIHHFDFLIIFTLQLTNDQNRLWLLLLDLYLRHFSKRDPKDREMEQKLYHECYLEGQLNKFISNKMPSAILLHITIHSSVCFNMYVVLNDKIWHNRVYLAAAISRIRIKNNALTLAEMLPSHLQDEKVAKAIANPIVTGWINPCVVT